MDVFPCGITGFWLSTDAPPPATNEREFLAVCHAAAQQLHGKVLSQDLVADHRACNFSVVTIQLPLEDIAVLLNSHIPLIAMSQPLSRQDLTIRFVDSPVLADAIRKCGSFTILTASELAQRISDDMLADLSNAEMQQIKYWKPATVGAMLFNFWD